MKQNNRLKERMGRWLLTPVLILVLALAVVWVGGMLRNKMLGGICLAGGPVLWGLALLVLYGAGLFQIIIHELGHLIFGLLSGYEFVSFRIGKWMLAAGQGGYKLRKYTVVGTAGQCLMLPPPRDEYGRYPTILYNLGGSAFNLLVAALCVLLSPLLPASLFLRIFFWGSALIGLLLGLSNAIPLKMGGIANDGHNAWSLKKDRAGSRAFWLQLQVNGLLTRGRALADLPREWFEMPGDDQLTNPLVCGLAAFCAAYHHDRQDFARAEAISRRLLEHAPGMLEVHRNELRCELLFYEIFGPCRQQQIDALYTKELKKYIKLTASYISRSRLQYAYALLVQHDESKAEKALARFEQVAKSYPFRGEVESERRLVELVRQKAQSRPGQ